MPDEERPPSLWWSMWKRFLIGGTLIVALSAGATATVALNTVGGIAREVFPSSNRIAAPKSLVAPEYSGGPATFLVLGSDRREGAKNAEERESGPHSDTILLVRLDPEQGQTSVMSIPRDLLVNSIVAPNGSVYADEKINAAYTVGSKFGGAKGGILLAAETIKREVFPQLKRFDGIIDVNFKGFIQVVDTLGCAYVNVDHHYLHQKGENGEEYTTIDLQPGYQKLCYENALNYVRYRHDDSDFVRVARQQDFLRDLREQVNPANETGQIDAVAKAVGHAIVQAGFTSSAGELIELTKLITFSQTKPLRQVKFLTNNVNAQIKGGDYVTSTPELEAQSLNSFLDGHEQLELPAAHKPSHHSSSHHHHAHASSGEESASALGLYPTSSSGESEMVKAALEVPFPVLYPRLQTGPAEQQQVRAYMLEDQQHKRHHAYVVVWQQNTIGEYYDFEGSDWLNPPLFAHARTQTIDGREYRFVNDGAHIHVIGWRTGKVLYWLTNTLLEDLSNKQMLALAKSAQTLD